MMGVSSYVRGFFSDFLIYSNMVILGIIGLPFAIASEKWAYSFIKLYIWTCFVVLRLVANIRVECRGEVPSGNVLICSKHMSFLDILMLAYYLPRASFVMKRELIWTPIIGIYGLRIGCVPVTRGGGARTLNTMLKNYEDASDNADGKQIIIYPQGTRVHPKESRNIK
jgi:1-acyl-sn-glycerol-3-phosphate acyltransferase